MNEVKFETWAYVELMGHNKISGFVSELKLGNQSMLRVDVPQIDDVPAFSKVFNVASIYALTPLDEKSAFEYAKRIKAKPLDVWDMQAIFEGKIGEMIKEGVLVKPELSAPLSVSEIDPLANIDFE